MQEGVVLEQQAMEPTSGTLSFSYAKRHGVLVSDINGASIQITHRENVSSKTLLELQRHFGLALHLTSITNNEFDKLLQQSYETQSGETMQAMEGLGDELDLSSIAQEIGEPEDLLETEDDAPIIRLINALLTQAVKENASDIHIEPFENRLLIRIRVDGVRSEERRVGKECRL